MRKGGAGRVAGLLVIAFLVAAAATLYEGALRPGSPNLGSIGNLGDLGSLGNIGASAQNMTGEVSSGISVLKGGLAFGAGGGLAQVETSGSGLIADTFTGNSTIAPTCSSSPRNSYVALTNTGSANGSATGVIITYGGSKNAFPISGPCTLGPAGSPTATRYILFGGPSKLPDSPVPEAGEPYLGTVTLTNGGQLPFTGRFSSGYPSVSATGLVMPANDFPKGSPANATCAATAPREGAYVELNNTGTVGTPVTLLTISWKNETNLFAISGACRIGPDGTPSDVVYLLFGPDSGLSTAAVSGQAFTGTVTLSTQTQVPFRGTFK
jgi:hypothetical protein